MVRSCTAKATTPTSEASTKVTRQPHRSPRKAPIGAAQTVATETPAAALRVADYATAPHPRLVGLTWGAEDLATALDATANRDVRGAFGLTFLMVRSAMLLAAKAAGVQAIDTLHADFRDVAGLASACRAAASEGFTGCLAIHPGQVEGANEVFAPSERAVEDARGVLEAWEAGAGSGVVTYQGRMVENLHVDSARRTLSIHDAIRDLDG